MLGVVEGEVFLGRSLFLGESAGRMVSICKGALSTTMLFSLGEDVDGGRFSLFVRGNEGRGLAFGRGIGSEVVIFLLDVGWRFLALDAGC